MALQIGSTAVAPRVALEANVRARRPRSYPRWVAGAAAIGWRVLVVTALAALLGRVALTLSTAVLAVLVGTFVAATCRPLVAALAARPGWTAAKAAGVASAVSLAAVLALAGLIVLAFVPYADAVVRAARTGADGLVGAIASQLPVPLSDALDRSITQLESTIPGTVAASVGSVATIVSVVILGGFFAFYAMADGERALALATARLDSVSARVVDRRAAVAIGEVGAYLRANVFTAVSSAVTQAVYLTILGVPLAGPLGVLVFTAAFVPYLGALFSTAVITLVAIASGGPAIALAFIALVVITAVVQRRVLERRVYRTAVRVHPALVMVVAPAGATLFGVVGLLLSVPVAAAAIAFLPAVRQVLHTDEPPNPGSVVPPWLDRAAQLSWRVLLIAGVLAVAVQTVGVSLLTGPVIVALVIACAANPASMALRRRGMSPTTAALVVTLLSALVAITILAAAVVSLATQLPAILDGATAGAVRIVPGDAVAAFVQMIEPDLLGASQAVASNLATVLVAIATAAALTFFFLRDGPAWWSTLLGHAPAARRADLAASGSQAARILNGSTFGSGMVSAVAGVLQALMMTVLGLPLAVPLGVLTFFSGFIPYVGGAIATALVILIAVAVGGPQTVVLVVVLTVVNNILIGNVVAPLVLGTTVKVHPAIVLLAAPVGAAVGGLVGMILIVPAISIARATWRSIAALFEPAADPAR